MIVWVLFTNSLSIKRSGRHRVKSYYVINWLWSGSNIMQYVCRSFTIRALVDLYKTHALIIWMQLLRIIQRSFHHHIFELIDICDMYTIWYYTVYNNNAIYYLKAIIRAYLAGTSCTTLALRNSHSSWHLV